MMDLSEELIRELFESSQDAILLIDHTGKIVNCNPQAAHLFGYPKPELVNMKFPTLIPERFHLNHRSYCEEYLASPRRLQMGARGDLWGIHREGRELPLDVTLQPMKNQDLIIAIIRDITEKKQIEGQLLETNLRYKAAERIAHLGHWELDLKNDKLFWSDETYRIFEVSPKNFQGSYKTFLGLVHPEDRGTFNQAYLHSVNHRTPFDIQHRIQMKDGRIKYLSVRCETFYADDEAPYRSIGTVQDITERKLAEERLQRQLGRLAALRTIDTAITGSIDLQAILDVVVEQTADQLHVDAVDVLLRQPRSELLEYSAGRGFRTDALTHTRLHLGEGYAGKAALNQSTISIPDLRNRKTDFLRSPSFQSEGFVSYLAVPLTVKGFLRGVIEVFTRTPLDPDPDWLNYLEMLAGQAAIALDNAQLFLDLEHVNTDLFRAYDETIEGWSHALDLRDKETEGHTRRVTELTVRLARSMGIKDSEIVHIRRGALLHDIGKMGVPDVILHKPGPLTEAEWDVMRQHPQLAYDMISPIAYLQPALDIPYCHHERWNGKGYPRRLKGEEIPFAARIFAVVDVWDALASERPYRAPWTKDRVIEYIRTESGVQFDPKVVSVFLQTIGSDAGR
jgi:PAS domain S-box-containing protein